MGPWPWVETETLAGIDLKALDDVELSNIARYRGEVARNTVPGHSDHEDAVDRLRAAYSEMIRRQHGG